MTFNIKSLAWIGLIFWALSFFANAAVETKVKEGDTELTRSAEAQAYHDQIQEVLAQKAFGEKKIVTGWRLKKPDEKEKKDKQTELPAWLKNLLDSMGFSDSFLHTSSAMMEALLWFLLITLVVYLLVKYRTQITNFVSEIGMPESPDLPTTMFGLDVKKTSIPKDVASSAKSLWQTGEHRQAIALLLRASLIKLIHEHNCRFLDSDTETECCERLKKNVPQPLSQYMHLLVQVWQQLAYAHRPPTDDTFNKLCHQWQEVF